MVSSYVVENNKDKIIQMIFDDKIDLKNKLILEENISPKINFSNDQNAKVEIKKYTPNDIVLQTDSKTNMILFVSDNYYSGWKVSIDGEFGKIYRADYSFRAVPVLRGMHEVRFWYSPNSFALGLRISIISFSIMLLALIALGIRGKNNVKK